MMVCGPCSWRSSAGSIAGPAVTATLAERIGVPNLLLLHQPDDTAVEARYELVDVVVSSSLRGKPRATVTLRMDGSDRSEEADGDGIVDEADETVQLALGAPTNATAGAILAHTFTINDDEIEILVTTLHEAIDAAAAASLPDGRGAR